MATIKVILRRDVLNLGAEGEIKQVAPGYFRNFLQPRGMAVEATKGQLNALQSNAKYMAAQGTRARERTSGLARQIESITLTMPVRVGEQGRIYGSITNKDISDALKQQADLSIDRRNIELREPLKSLGVHSVPVKLEHGVDAHVQVELVPESEVART